MPKIIIKNIKRPKVILVCLLNKMHFLSDTIYLKIRYFIEFNRKLNLNKPETFNEKLNWLKIYNRKPLHKKLVDKYEVRKYIEDRLGEEYLIPLLGVWDKWTDIDFDSLPNEFVLKCTHDSRSVVICKDKNNFDFEAARKKICKKLKKDLFWWGREWVYKDLKPRIIAEKYMVDSKTNELNDYKFFCFNGKVECILVCAERNSSGGLKEIFYDTRWQKMPFERPNHPSCGTQIPRPINFDRMIDLAEMLSDKEPFVRIDFYEINEKIYFGEITFFPAAGFEKFAPNEWDLKLGNLINIDVL